MVFTAPSILWKIVTQISPCWFIPHTSHLVQPLDGQAYQVIKHYFRTANTEEVMWGGSASQKTRSFPNNWRYPTEDDCFLTGFDTPSPEPEPSSSATNSPPNSTIRVNKLNKKLIDEVKSMQSLSKKKCNGIYSEVWMQIRFSPIFDCDID